MKLFAGIVCVLFLLPSVWGNCALYGCTSSLSFTCPTDFWPPPPPPPPGAGSSSRGYGKAAFWPDLAYSYEDKTLMPTGSGCVTNDGKILCPFAGGGKNFLLSWDIFAQYATWNMTMHSLIPLPAMDTDGQLYVADGFELCGFQSNRKPFGPCIKMEPVTGPLFDLAIVDSKYLYLLYKCGFMVAYFVSDGTAFASIWLNETLSNINGTFVPLSNPAVSGMRVYFMAAFKPTPPVPAPGVHLRLYAIDVRSIMVGRIKVIWYHDLPLSNGSIPYMMGSQVDCEGESDPMAEPVANVFFDNGTVVASVNYGDFACNDRVKCRGLSATHSLLMSVNDGGDSYRVNFIKMALPPFQAMAYASPSFTESRCVDHASTSPPPPPSDSHEPAMWVSWAGENGNSAIQKVNIETGKVIRKLDIEGIRNAKVTSKMTIFYNDQVMQCGSNSTDKVITPLIFGTHADGKSSIVAVDVTAEPSLLWTQSGPLGSSNPVVGQMTSVGNGRDTMMAMTTTKGAYFYILFAET